MRRVEETGRVGLTGPSRAHPAPRPGLVWVGGLGKLVETATPAAKAVGLWLYFFL